MITVHTYHPGRNDYKITPWKMSFFQLFLLCYNIIPPRDSLCNVAATGGTLFARQQAKEFALQSDCIVIVYEVDCAKTFFGKSFFVIIFGRNGTYVTTLHGTRPARGHYDNLLLREGHPGSSKLGAFPLFFRKAS